MSSIWNYIRGVLCNPDTSISMSSIKAKLKTFLLEKQKLCDLMKTELSIILFLVQQWEQYNRIPKRELVLCFFVFCC